MAEKYDYQFIIIGGGAAGFAAAIKADQLKKKTLMVSAGKVALGGTCINVGCMPSKRLLTVAEDYWNARHSKYDGISDSSPDLDFKKVVESKDALINKLQSKAYAGTLKFLVYVTLKEMAIDSKTEEIVGIHMAGAKADEIISIASFIIKHRMKLDDIIENTFIFPTMAESIKWLAQSFRKDVSKLSCCTE